MTPGNQRTGIRFTHHLNLEKTTTDSTLKGSVPFSLSPPQMVKMEQKELPKKLREIINLRILLILLALLFLVPSVSAGLYASYNPALEQQAVAAGYRYGTIHLKGYDTIEITKIEFLPDEYSVGLYSSGYGASLDANVTLYTASPWTAVGTGHAHGDSTGGGLTIWMYTWDQGNAAVDNDFTIVIRVLSPLAQYDPYVQRTPSGNIYGPISIPDGSHLLVDGTTSGGYILNVYDDSPDYTANVSGTGTFCYAQPITFNVSLNGYTDQYAFYWHHFYKDGNPVSYYTEFDGNDDGFMSFSKSLPPGDYVTEAIIEFEDYELSEYLNFTIEDDCSQAFNGTINETYDYGDITNFTWEWDDYDFLDNLTPWENPTFNNGTGTSLIDYMLTNGYINQTEYDFLNQSVQNYINETNFYENMTGNYVFGFLTPLEMVNDGITTVRANINGSVSFLTDGIEPVTSIFAVVFQIMPSWVVTIFSIVLTFDAVRIILAGRKN